MASLRFGPQEEEVLAAQLGRVVEYIDQLREFPVAEAAPAAAAGTAEAADAVAPSLERDLLLANAPEAREGFLLVPKVRADA